MLMDRRDSTVAHL